ncbi:biliverdin-producing heme oxygenase [Pseudomonas fluorescens]|uniref:Biliverdin-producing heme oxygenase n=1 Tax=Pseudomonas fluorescens TaxID=294 RepID=A0A944DWP7_PSEFL|nr:biliverdin-producing heme oxygenase [Pseudomonas fluorescens]MBT2297234.1 biliverdin-producing heme oxygenase [Pseudomonas fluorescens]MBT2306434.1 biliverdin-producing heme oxygenase [Pseudomonas fluorescens]MBT2315245.1 biliverdin-producing heme oxygenase [Pseudomonas fluorescens]MBT2318864.1 biliverdin-producing heme oxygenase [Pseudomonas fluorescens]MBT2328401.1 biliverdin-producing heme oxygenase [Pseudomonas fluorescens]
MSPAAPPPSLIQALRTETAELHVALEKRLPFFSEQLDLDLYRRLMAAYYGFYKPLEQRLHVLTLTPTGLDQSLRIKLPVLRADLTALGLSDHAIETLPTCADLPQIDSRTAALGVSYVLEGATLGGQILRRRVAEQLGLDAASGAAFLNVYGELTGRRWKDFLQYLGDRNLGDAQTLEVTRAAKATFTHFEHWLDSQKVLL